MIHLISRCVLLSAIAFVPLINPVHCRSILTSSDVEPQQISLSDVYTDKDYHDYGTDDVGVLVPPTLRFSSNFDRYNSEDVKLMANVNEAYRGAIALARYALRDVTTDKPLAMLGAKTFFPEEYLGPGGIVERVLRTLALQNDRMGLDIFNYAIVDKDSAPPNNRCGTKTMGFLQPLVGTDDRKARIVVCPLGYSVGGILDKQCNQFCDKPDVTWETLSNTLAHELLHIQAIGNRLMPQKTQIIDVEFGPNDPTVCKGQRAYGWVCTRELKKLHPKKTIYNADSYANFLMEKWTLNQCPKRNPGACRNILYSDFNITMEDGWDQEL